MVSKRNGPWGAVGRAPSCAAALSLCACSVVNAYEDPALVGDWESEDPIANGERNQLEADLDGEGKATIFYTPDNVYLHQDELDLRWEQTDEEEFEIELDCELSTLFAGGCGAHDFRMVCDVKDDGDELRCESSHPYTGLLRWKRD
ncbi:MAG: hypothetical protein JRI55_03220 [Deltaproteobacteria bacterium]|nr:hypothetical protein [Deltaproteobacteria bacterium]